MYIQRLTRTVEKKIIAWVKRSTSVNYAILFYSKDDVYHVGKMRSRLLQINPSLRFKQISDIQEFIDYIDTGMDRTQHPVQEIRMIHVYSTWDKQGEVDYIEEARKRHEPEVRQVSREAMKELFEGMIINIFLSNGEEHYEEQNKTALDTHSEAEEAKLSAEELSNSIGKHTAKGAKKLIDASKDISDRMNMKIPEIKTRIPNVGWRAAGAVSKSIPYAKDIVLLNKSHDASIGLQKRNKRLDQLSNLYSCDDKNNSNYDMDRCLDIGKARYNSLKIYVIDHK